MEAQRLTGTIAMWLPDKGYGFANVEGLDGKVFCHRSQIRQTPGLQVAALFPGVRITFVPVEDAKGIQALDIEIVPGKLRFNLSIAGETAVRSIY